MITLAHFLALLESAPPVIEHPAIARLSECERTAWGLARAYLPRCVFASAPPLTGPLPVTEVIGLNAVMVERRLRWTLDLTDPGTAHALLAALALALGLDPGVGGVGCSWRPDGPGWRLESVATTLAQRGCVWFEQRDQDQLDDTTDPGGGDGQLDMAHTMFLHAPTVAAESDPIKALALAALHVLEHP